ncbi:MAG: hypothetical protein KJ799_05230 [Bacteroidetes bacterium]|nr:hypothetical protein [Bacteroidota bacterium]MBU1680972.1 hypothetical protein [Bacteroidota bacterium]MBU2506110.1 hypothetical protein [Bacteroidota bacterium]
MKNIIMKIAFFIIFTAGAVFSQFRDAPTKPENIKSSITNANPSSLYLGFINPTNFNMSHSVNMSYSAFGNNGIAMSVYTNSMAYRLSEDIDIEVDASFVNSPYSSFGEEHAKSLSGIYLSRAQINYQPSENFFITFQYLGGANNYYNPYGFNSYSPLSRGYRFIR